MLERLKKVAPPRAVVVHEHNGLFSFTGVTISDSPLRRRALQSEAAARVDQEKGEIEIGVADHWSPASGQGQSVV